MIKRDIPNSDLTLSVVGLGCWAIGGAMWGAQDDADSIQAIHAAVDAGVTWIDTAPIYGSGHSETIVGQAVQELPAERRPMIFTKFGLGDSLAQHRKSATRAEILSECEASLRRLRCERIDLYQLHWPVEQPMAEIAGACAELLQAGKIAAVGVSNFSVAQLGAWQATGKPLHCLQAPYSLLRPAISVESTEEAEGQLPWCFANKLGCIAYSPLFRGMLFGTWNAEHTFAADDIRGQHRDYSGVRFQRHLVAIDELRILGAEHDLTVPQLAIGALLATPGLTACIVGARNARQGAALAELPAFLSQQQLTAVEDICARLRVVLAEMPAADAK